MPKTAVSKKFYEIERDSLGKILSVTILPDPKTGKIYEIGSNYAGETTDGKSVIKAAGKFFRFHEYDLEKSEVGLHVYSGQSLDSWYGRKVAVVAADYAGTHQGEFGISTEDWMQIDRINGKTVLVPFAPQWKADRVRIHIYVNAFLLGIGFKVRVVPFNTNGWFDQILSTWEEENDETARKMRNQGYAHAQSRKFIDTLVREKIKTGEIVVTKKAAVVPTLETITLTTIDGELLELAKLEPQTIKVHDARNNVFAINWDRSDIAVARFAQISLAKGWTVELK